MPKSPKKSSSSKPSSPSQNWLPLLITGAVGFAGAFLLLKGCPFSRMSCPVYSEICPVTSALGKVEKALAANDLASARASAEKLQDLLANRMPDLSQAARRLAGSQNLAEARINLADFKKKMESASYQPASTAR